MTATIEKQPTGKTISATPGSPNADIAAGWVVSGKEAPRFKTRTAAAIAASTVDNVSLAAVHAEPVSNWKGISPAITGMRAVYTTMLAGRGITGPAALFEGPSGLEQLFDQTIDMRPGDRSLTAVEQTYLKQYCSLIHGQAIIDATLAIRDDHRLVGSDVASVHLEVSRAPTTSPVAGVTATRSTR